MRVVCVYREGMDYSREVSDWLADFKRFTGREIEVLDPDENVGFCEAHGVVEYPTILAISDRGDVTASWRGKTLPLRDEVLYYMI